MAGLFVFFILSVRGAQALEVQWHEPKVKATKVQGLFYVELIGRTDPLIKVSVEPKTIVVIQRAQANDTTQPRVPQEPIQSDEKGWFRIRLFMPEGLSQLPIVFEPTGEKPQSVLLTMRVDPNEVNLNVKVTRRKQIVKVMETPPSTYSVSAGWVPQQLKKTFSPEGSSDIEFAEQGALGFRLEGGAKYLKWGWLSQLELAKLNDFTYQGFLLGGRYRLTESDHELWAGVDVDATVTPFMARNSSNQNVEIESRIFRAGLGLIYSHQSEKRAFRSSLFYREPFSLKIESGEIAYSSRYTVSFDQQVRFQPQNSFGWVLGGAVEYGAFKYEYLNTPALINNRGTGTSFSGKIFVMMEFSFAGKKDD